MMSFDFPLECPPSDRKIITRREKLRLHNARLINNVLFSDATNVITVTNKFAFKFHYFVRNCAYLFILVKLRRKWVKIEENGHDRNEVHLLRVGKIKKQKKRKSKQKWAKADWNKTTARCRNQQWLGQFRT